MKILFVAHSEALSGGANRSLLSVMKGLRDTWGIEPSLLVPAADGVVQKICEVDGIPVYVGSYHTCCTVYQREPKDLLRFCKLLLAPGIDWLQAGRLLRKLPQDFDLVYTNERMILVGACLAKRWGIPHIWHVRSFGRENRTRYLPFYLRYMGQHSDRVIAISGALCSSLAAKGIPKEKLRMIHNGVEIERYAASERIGHEGFRMLLTGRIVPEKGQDEAVQALALLKEMTDRRVDLYFAGKIPSYDESGDHLQLKKRIFEAGLEDQVHFLGEVSDVAKLRQEMDLELVCSWCETFGRVTVEAMCAELPVIGSDAGGTPEIIADRETGLLYPPHDVRQLARKILWCMEHPQECRKMGERGLVRARECFAVERTVQNIYRTISEVTAEEAGKK